MTSSSQEEQALSPPKGTSSGKDVLGDLSRTTNLSNFSRDGKENKLSKTQLAVAERLARQLHEMEKKKQEESKRKRDNKETNYRVVRRKVEEQRENLEVEERQTSEANRELYSLFNSLQGVSKDLKLDFEYPEIVVVGMQSDGKSTFIEGLLGFQFNIVESNIGTRRPLILQMINNPRKEHPSCRFRKESPSPEEDPYEEEETPVHDLNSEIVRRTNEKAGKGTDKVSDIPIILRVEYAHCANLTIYDTPGFRLGGNEFLRKEIENMVLRLIKPANRIIVCLEQSTVEWANTTSRPIVRQIDPTFSRTILVNTKFDNRVKELQTTEAANTYLRGEALPEGTTPFFVSMPYRRNLGSRFQDAIREAFLEDYEKLLEVNFDEKKYLPQLGLFRVKKYLESLLHDKYSQSLAPTLRALEEICKNTELELEQVNKQINAHDIKQLKKTTTLFARAFVDTIEKLLAGSIVGDPEKNGETLSEEKLSSGVQEWPNFDIDFNIQNAQLKIYGGAQYSRLLNEFEYVAHSREFPKTTPSEIASALGLATSGLETAAANLVQMKAKQVFLPLMDIVLKRCSYLMKRLFFIAISVLKRDEDKKSIAVLTVYDRFLSVLQQTFDNFISKIEEDCRSRLKDDFVMFTKIFDWDLFGKNFPNFEKCNFLDTTPEQTKERVEQIMSQKNSELDGGLRSESENDSYKQVALMSSKMFAGIRYFFAKYVRNKLNAFFFDPMIGEVGPHITDHFYSLSDAQYEEIFLDGMEELKEMKEKLDYQLNLCIQQRDKFKEAYYSMKSSKQCTK